MLVFYLQHEIGKCRQLWNPEDPQLSSRILENINSIRMKVVDTFFAKAFTSTIRKTSMD